MSYIDNRLGLLPVERPMRRQWRPAKWMVFVYFIGLIALGSIELITRKAYDGALIAASEYHWPEGCEVRVYRPGDRLPKACFSLFQKISSRWAGDHHLKITQARRSYYSYYRLGNDAVSPLCVVGQDTCTISWLYRELFVPDPSILDASSSAWRTVPAGEKPAARIMLPRRGRAN